MTMELLNLGQAVYTDYDSFFYRFYYVAHELLEKKS